MLQGPASTCILHSRIVTGACDLAPTTMASDRHQSGASSSRSDSRRHGYRDDNEDDVKGRHHSSSSRHHSRRRDEERREHRSYDRDGRERDRSDRDRRHDGHRHSSRSHHVSSRDKRPREEEDRRHSRHRSDRHSPSHSSSKRRKDGSADEATPSTTTHIHDDDQDQQASMPVAQDDAPTRDPAVMVASAQEATSIIPTSESLKLQSHPNPTYSDDPAPLPPSASALTSLKRDDWMLSQPQAASDPVGAIVGPEGRSSHGDLRADGVRDEVDLERTGEKDSSAQADKVVNGDDDFFANLGQQRIKQPKEEKPDPEKLRVSSRELNTQFAEGKHLDSYTAQPKRKLEFGSPGYQWRMMKLRKTYEQAEQEGRSIEAVALERYGDEASFQEAKEEQEWLDRKGGGQSRGGPAATSRFQRPGESRNSTPQRPPLPSGSNRSFMFTDLSLSRDGTPSTRPISRQSFRKPGESSAPSTPGGGATPSMSRMNSAQSAASTPKPATPIPSVFTPQVSATRPAAPADDESAPSAAVHAAIDASQSRDAVTSAPLDAEALNKLEAKVLKAEMTGKANAGALREKLEKEKARATKGGDQGEGYFDQGGSVQPGGSDSSTSTNIQVLPTLDGRGRLYDVGNGKSGEAAGRALPPGNRRRKGDKVETHDPKTGEFMRYNADDDDITLEEMVRQERFKAGSGVTKDYDAEISDRIARDGAFKDTFDYLDENVEKLARKKMRSDALKRQFAINDFAKTKKALESCRFCFQNEGESPPLARVVASGTRAYLAVPENEPLVEGHALIVPIQHNLSTLEAEDDTWDEIKNFMKFLLQQASQKGQGVVFYETVTSLKHQRHSYIEAVPLDLDLIAALPGNFRQELLSVESEWSTHHKIINFTPERPFRRSMVPSLPYFMVQFDYKGEKGYGHVIEGNDSATAFEEESDPYGMSESSRGTGGSKFERFFAAEVIGGLLDLEPRHWKRPRRLDQRQGAELLSKYKREWEPYDWTKMLREQAKTTPKSG